MPDDNQRHEFLMKDFEQWNAELARSESAGDARLTQFIALATTVLGALGVLAKKNDVYSFANVDGLAPFALGALWLIGVLTYLRTLRRNHATDGCKYALRTIRSHYTSSDFRAELMSRFPDKGKETNSRSFKNGGVKELMMLFNSFLAGALAASLGIGPWGFAVAGASIVAHLAASQLL